MWWKTVKIAGIVSAVLITLLFVAILILVTRPAVLVGVDGTYLANSLAGGTGEPECRKAGDGTWDCYQLGNPPPRYRVEVDWMGCWEAARLTPARGSSDPRERDGCIELGDIITFD